MAATDPTASIVNSLGGIPPWMFALIAAMLLIAMTAWAVIAYIGRKKEDDQFQITGIEKILKKRFDQRLSDFGQRNNSYLRKDYRYLGKIVKDVRISGRSQVPKNSDVKDIVSSVDKDVVDKYESTGLITPKDARRLKDENFVNHRYSIVRDKGIEGWVGYNVIDRLLKKENYHKKLLYPEVCVKDAAQGNNVIIDKDVQFEPIAGMYAANTSHTFSLLEMVHFQELYERSLESQENYFDKVNFYDSEFSKTIQNHREKAEAESKRFQGVGNKHANNN